MVRWYSSSQRPCWASSRRCAWDCNRLGCMRPPLLLQQSAAVGQCQGVHLLGVLTLGAAGGQECGRCFPGFPGGRGRPSGGPVLRGDLADEPFGDAVNTGGGRWFDGDDGKGVADLNDRSLDRRGGAESV